ncbi:MAG: heavy-metal-associated domain-containing protein [Vulcanimicrobiaceae bacterium]
MVNVNVQVITIAGMTCQNCVRHVTAALCAIPGVQHASVDLGRGTALLEAEREIPHAELAGALDSAGYILIA